VTATYARTAGETVAGSPYTISATLSPAGVLDNYEVTYNTANLTVTRRAASVTPDAKSKILGAADPVLTGTLSGFLGGDSVTATYTRTPGETIAGSPYTISATLAPVAVLGNYTITYNTANFTIFYGWNGFLQPINDTAHQTGVNESKFKLGQTIPAKFVLKNASGLVVQQTPNPTFTRTGNLGSCDSAATLETIVEPVTPDDAPVYKWDGNQYHYNWSTKGLTAGEYRIYANIADGTKPYVDICLTK
jgi:MBG domain (YGX type)